MKLTSLLVIHSAIGLFAVAPLHGVGNAGLAGRNPALSYWQAAAQLPELSDAQAKRLNAVADGKEAFGEDVLDGLEFGAAMTFLRKAAASEADCDWGLAWEDAAEMSVPHLSKVRELSSITLVLAEAEFAKGAARRLAAAGFLKRVEASKNPLVRMLMPNLTGLIRSEDTVLALQAMLKIALERGPDITADDVAGTPFVVTRKEGKLQSIADAGGVTLRFGAPE